MRLHVSLGCMVIAGMFGGCTTPPGEGWNPNGSRRGVAPLDGLDGQVRGERGGGVGVAVCIPIGGQAGGVDWLPGKRGVLILDQKEVSPVEYEEFCTIRGDAGRKDAWNSLGVMMLGRKEAHEYAQWKGGRLLSESEWNWIAENIASRGWDWDERECAWRSCVLPELMSISSMEAMSAIERLMEGEEMLEAPGITRGQFLPGLGILWEDLNCPGVSIARELSYCLSRGSVNPGNGIVGGHREGWEGIVLGMRGLRLVRTGEVGSGLWE